MSYYPSDEFSRDQNQPQEIDLSQYNSLKNSSSRPESNYQNNYNPLQSTHSGLIEYPSYLNRDKLKRRNTYSSSSIRPRIYDQAVSQEIYTTIKIQPEATNKSQYNPTTLRSTNSKPRNDYQFRTNNTQQRAEQIYSYPTTLDNRSQNKLRSDNYRTQQPIQSNYPIHESLRSGTYKISSIAHTSSNQRVEYPIHDSLKSRMNNNPPLRSTPPQRTYVPPPQPQSTYVPPPQQSYHEYPIHESFKSRMNSNAPLRSTPPQTTYVPPRQMTKNSGGLKSGHYTF